MNVKTTAEKMKTAMKKNSFSELAEELDITLATIDSWKRRKTIPNKYLLKVSEKTGVSLDWLLSEEKPTFHKNNSSKNSIQSTEPKNGYTLTLDLTKEQIEKLENIAKSTGITAEQLTKLALFKNEYIL